MKFSALRHAISVFNETGTSDKNCELSDAGKKQASRLSGNYDVIVCSAMKRCRQTMYESMIFGTEVFQNYDCREFKKDICDYIEGEDETVLETEEELLARVENFKEYLRRLAPKGSILVISHGDFLNRLSGKKVEFKNAQLSQLEISDEVAVVEEVAVAVEEAPVAVEEAPVAVEEAPVAVEEAPVAVEEVAVALEEAPVVVEEVAVEEAPVAVEASVAVEEAPVAALVLEEVVVEAPVAEEAAVAE